ncbi:MAG: hypothetical protein JWM74_424 [Myxococcaceae bacterium]|jgi:hypothetical protein|nr:hypothetical protein [Myxococcaceae bacterium]
MTPKSNIVPSKPQQDPTDEEVDPEDLEVVWDQRWASDHPSNRTPTERPGPPE